MFAPECGDGNQSIPAQILDRREETEALHARDAGLEGFADARRKPSGDIAIDGVALRFHRAALGLADGIGDLVQRRLVPVRQAGAVRKVERCLGLALFQIVGIHQRAMHEQVGIAADGRGEMRVAAQRQPEMPGIGGTVIGLRLAAQHRFHHQRALGRVTDPFDRPIEKRRRDDLPQRQLAVLRGEIIAQRNQLFAGRLFVHAIDDRGLLRFERLGRGDVRRDHEIFHHPVCVEPFAHGDFGDAALLVQLHPAFGQIEVQRLTRLARLVKQLPRTPEMGQLFVRLARIDGRLRILVGNVSRQPDDCAGEAPVADASFRINAEMAGHRRAILPLLETAHIGAEHFGQHRDDPVGKIDRIAALAGFAVQRAARAHVVADIRDGDDGAVAALAVRFGPDRVIVVARIGRIDREDRDAAQIFAFVLVKRQLGCTLRLLQRLGRKDMRNAMLGNGDQTEIARCERIAVDLDNLERRARALAGAFAQNELTGLGPTQIPDRRG